MIIRRFSGLTALIVLATLVVPGVSVSAASKTIDGLFEGAGPLKAGKIYDVVVTGRGGVPASGVGAVALNVTATNPTGPSFLTVWPTGETKPNASNLNVVGAQTVPNMVIAKVGSGGKVSIFNSAGSVDVVVDVLGWFPTDGSFTTLNPARLLDTRTPGTTIDGRFTSTGPVAGGTATNLVVTGRGGVPSSGVDAVAINITATNSTDSSYVTVWPAGTERPTASNLNIRPNQIVPNMAIVKVGAGGSISLANFAGNVDLIVDVLGWFPVGGSYTGLAPGRILETRSGESTVDGLMQGSGALGTATLDVPITGRAGVPSGGVDAVAVNVTVTNPTAASFVTVWPAGASKPTASNLNMVAGQTVANMVIVKVGTGGRIALANSAGATDVIIDVLGWFPTGGSYTALTPARLADTRSADSWRITAGPSADGVVSMTVSRNGQVRPGGLIDVYVKVQYPRDANGRPVGGPYPMLISGGYRSGDQLLDCRLSNSTTTVQLCIGFPNMNQASFNFNDIPNHPSDITAVLDIVLANPDQFGAVDQQRIVYQGISMGGISGLLLVHPTDRDPRIRAVISYKGFAPYWIPEFGERATWDAGPEVLMINGTADTTITYELATKTFVRAGGSPKLTLISAIGADHGGGWSCAASGAYVSAWLSAQLYGSAMPTTSSLTGSACAVVGVVPGGTTGDGAAAGFKP